MKCWVYSSPTGVEECLIVPEGTRLGNLDVDIFNRFRHAEIWKTIDVEPGGNLVALDSDQAIQDIEDRRYHIAAAGIRTIEEWPGKPGAGD